MNLLLANAAQQGGGYSMIILMVVIFVIMWFFMIRPQQKKQKKLDEQRNNMSKGDKVITSGGIYGTVKGVKDNSFIIEIAEETRIEVIKSSVYPAEEPQQ